MFFMAVFLIKHYDHELPTISGYEVFFWVWTITRAMGELGELGMTRREVWLYIRDVWNQVDVAMFLLVMTTMAMRLAGAPSDISDGNSLQNTPVVGRLLRQVVATGGLDLESDPSSGSDLAGAFGDVVHITPRNIYAITVILAFCRVLQFLRYFRWLQCNYAAVV